MNNIDISKIIEEVYKQLSSNDHIELEASAKHVHLCAEHMEILFGKELTIDRELSQPGQYLYKERINLIGPKNMIRNVAILGPARPDSQVELSVSDVRLLGIKPVFRLSGDIADTPGIILNVGNKAVSLDKGVIVAKRHIHMTQADADSLEIKDRAIVSVKVEGERGTTFNNIIVRVSDSFQKRLHLDYDEANAAGITPGMMGKIIK